MQEGVLRDEARLSVRETRTVDVQLKKSGRTGNIKSDPARLKLKLVSR